MRLCIFMGLIGCSTTSTLRPPPPSTADTGQPSLGWDGPASLLARDAKRPTVAVQTDGRTLIGYQRGNGLRAVIQVSLLSPTGQLLSRNDLSQDAGNHIQVAQTSSGWRALWVITGHLGLMAADLMPSGSPRAAPRRLVAPVGAEEIDYPDLEVWPTDPWLATWSVTEPSGETAYALRAYSGSQPIGGLLRPPPLSLALGGGPPTVCANSTEALLMWTHHNPNRSAVGAQLLSSPGVPQAPPLWVAQRAGDRMTRPACVGVDGLGWVVGWRAMDGRADHRGTFLRFLGADATPAGPTQIVDPTGEGVAMAAHGDDLVLAWADYDSDGAGVALQLWSITSQAPQGPVLRVNHRQAGRQGSVDVAVWRDGGRLRGTVAWHDIQASGASEVRMRSFSL